MLLKRQYDHSSGSPVLTHVRVLRAPKIQKFSTGFIEQQAAAGILSIGGGKITLKTAEGEPDLTYKIISGPGYYCCHCNAPMNDGPEARAHIAKEHKDAKSSDPSNPAGYRKDNFYFCEKEG